MATLTVVAGKPFEWRRGVRLQAVSETQLVLPGGLWVQGQALATVIEVSDDDARIAVDQAGDGSVRKIHVFLKPGQHVILHRNSEAIALAKEAREIQLNVLQDTNAA